MSHNKVVLLLGSNLGDRKKNLSNAKKLINTDIGEITSMSEIIESIAEDYESQNNFLNATLKVNTKLTPVTLLKKIKEIEQIIGREYTENQQRYQDRLIDIDILFFNNIKYESKKLNIPHPQIYYRNFIKKILN